MRDQLEMLDQARRGLVGGAVVNHDDLLFRDA